MFNEVAAKQSQTNPLNEKTQNPATYEKAQRKSHLDMYAKMGTDRRTSILNLMRNNTHRKTIQPAIYDGMNMDAPYSTNKIDTTNPEIYGS